MRTITLSFLCYTIFNQALLGQKIVGVWGNVKPERINTLLYSELDSSTCLVNFSSGIVEGEKYYFIVSDSLCQNTFYTAFSNKVHKYYVVYFKVNKYLMEESSFSNIKEIDTQLKIAKEKTPDINERIAFAPKEIEKFEKDKIIAEKLQSEKEAKKLDSLGKMAEKNLTSYRNKNRVLWNDSWSYNSEYSSSADIKITVINPYKQKIKYIWFTFIAFNAVDDLVKDGITGKTEKKVQGIGPLDYGERGTYDFEGVFYSKVIERVKVKQIKIQFFDGSIKVITNPGYIGM